MMHSMTNTEMEKAMWSLFHQGHIKQASQLARKLPHSGRARMIQATLAWRDGDVERALGLADRAADLAMEDLQVLGFFSRIHMEIGDPEKGLLGYRAALELGKGLSQALDLALNLLFLGRYEEGWHVYDSRVPWEMRRLGFKGPLWEGQRGEPIQVLHEGGFGDSIQFCRFLRSPELAGLDLTVRVPSALKRLFQYNFPEVRLLDDANPAMHSCLMMSLARIAGIGSPAEVQGGRYLKAPKSPVPLLGPRGSRLRVGICWGGSPLAPRDPLRSLSHQNLQKLVDLPVDWVSLQVGRSEDWPEEVPCLQPALLDFMATAQFMEELDLIVTVDTSVAHLCGALGHPGLVLVPSCPDFRWAPNVRWYDSLELVHQKRPGDWDSVIDEVKGRINRLIAHKETIQ